MALTLPRFSFQNLVDFKRQIKLVCNDETLPIIFISDKVTKDYSVATHPVDKNIKISDTIWSEPAKLDLEGFVSNRNYPLVLERLSKSISDGLLWKAYYMGGIFNNMAITSFSKETNSEYVTSYKVTISLQEIVKIEPQTTVISESIVKKSSEADTKTLGMQQSKKADSSLAKQIVNKVGATDFIGSFLGI